MILSLSVLPANPGTPTPVTGDKDSANVFEDIVTALLPTEDHAAPTPETAQSPGEATNAGQATAESTPEFGTPSQQVSAGFAVPKPRPGLPVPEAEAAGSSGTLPALHHPDATWQQALDDIATGLSQPISTGVTTPEKLAVGHPVETAMPSLELPVSALSPALGSETAAGVGETPEGNPVAGAVDGYARDSGAIAKMPRWQSAAGHQAAIPESGVSSGAVANLPLADSTTSAVPGGVVPAMTSTSGDVAPKRTTASGGVAPAMTSPAGDALAGNLATPGGAVGAMTSVSGDVTPVPQSATFTATEAEADPELATPADTGMPRLVHAGAEPDAQPLAPLASPPVTPRGIETSLTPQTGISGLEAVNGADALAVENTVSRGTQPPPINRQLVGPIAVLAAGPHGDRTLSINIAPEALGPVTVKAHLGHEGLRVELTAPTEAGREALRAMLPELRRDLATTGAGSITIGTNTEHATGSGHGGANPGTAGDQRFGTGSPGYPPRGRPAGEVPADLPATGSAAATQHSTHLDVMA